ncbi:MAG: YceI family protein [Bacteroidota bacterium]
MPLVQLSPQSTQAGVSFQLKKLGFITVKGMLSRLEGTIDFRPADLENSSFNVSIPTKSINTENEKRDEHLRGPDFFFVEKYPAISFKSSAVVKENSHYLAQGELTILATEKQVEIPFQFTGEVLSGQFTLNRIDYQLGKKFPAFFIAKTVSITFICDLN